MNRHRDHRSPRILSVRPMVRDDLEHLRNRSARIKIQKLRDSHHNIARLFASGLKLREIAEASGYSISRLSILRADPTFAELVATYHAKNDAAIQPAVDAYLGYIHSNGLKAERMVADRLDEADESNERIPLKELLAIARDSADRVGYPKKTVQTNLNVNFAANLEAARRRHEERQRLVNPP